MEKIILYILMFIVGIIISSLVTVTIMTTKRGHKKRKQNQYYFKNNSITVKNEDLARTKIQTIYNEVANGTFVDRPIDFSSFEKSTAVELLNVLNDADPEWSLKYNNLFDSILERAGELYHGIDAGEFFSL